MADTNELTPEEVDEQNQRLLQDLRHMYPTQADVAPPPARIQQRLFHGSNEIPGDDASTRLPFWSPGMQPSSANAVNTQGWAWQRHGSQVAAAVVVVLLVGTLILTLNLAHRSHTGGSRTPPDPTEMPTSLHMIDATTGWVLTENTVLRTTDGGSHWQNVTPANTSLSPGSVADFHTASLAWIVTRQAGASTAQVWRTIDGGQTWQQSTVQSPLLVKQITFIDAQHGWILSGKKNAAVAPAEIAQILRTVDGGKTWQSVSTALFSDVTPSGHLPYGGQKSGIHFLNVSTGWVTGTVMFNDLAWLYVTHDGGSTWYQQTLPKPSGVPSAQLSIMSPTFFSVTDGILPVKFSDLTTERDIATVIYVTHNGGTTWKPTTPVSTALRAADFLDTQHGWVTDGTSLFMTSDGGQHWTRLAASANFEHATQLDFVSGTLGWAISDQGNGSSFLLKTMDGGQTWTPISIATS